MKREALQVWNQENQIAPQLSEEPSVKVFLSEENRIIDDNYITGKSAYPIRHKIDWFSLYAKKAYNFRKEKGLYDRIKASIKQRDISPRSKVEGYQEIEDSNK